MGSTFIYQTNTSAIEQIMRVAKKMTRLLRGNRILEDFFSKSKFYGHSTISIRRAARNKFKLIPGTTVGPESDNRRPPVPERVVHQWQLKPVY